MCSFDYSQKQSGFLLRAFHAPIANGSIGIFAGNFNHPSRTYNLSKVITRLLSNLVLTKTALSSQLRNAHMKGEKREERWNLAFLSGFKDGGQFWDKKKRSPGKQRRQTGELELMETPGWARVLHMRADKVKSSYVWASVRRRDVQAGGGGGHFPSSMDRLLTFWLAAGLTPTVHHWVLSIPQHPQTAHKFWGPGMNSASQHLWKGCIPVP